MYIYILKRVFHIVPVLALVTLLVFFLLRAAPGDAARIYLQDTGMDLSKPLLEKTRAKLGLDRPVIVQYLDWLGKVAKGDFGRSIATKEKVSKEILTRLKRTLLLALPALFVSILISLPLGFYSALRRGKIIDCAAHIYTIVFMSIPAFCLGLILILIFSVRLRIFPIPGSGYSAIILPCVTLIAALSAYYMRLVHNIFSEELSKEYLRAVRFRGIKQVYVICHHLIKNAAAPVVTSLAMSLGFLIGGSAVVEKVFSYPGIGSYLIDAIARRDYNVVQACVLLFAVVFVLLNLAADIACIAFDPRTASVNDNKSEA